MDRAGLISNDVVNLFLDDDTKNKRALSQHKYLAEISTGLSTSRLELKPGFLQSGPARSLRWPGPFWVWTATGKMASGTWLKPPPGGQLSQGLKPLALAQLPEPTPPSAESQSRTSGRGLAPPLLDPVPCKW